MSRDLVLTRPPRLPLRHRPAALFAVAVARLLTHLSPYRMSQILMLLRRGAASATVAQAAEARATVTNASRHCRGPQGCLPRSLATTLLCRMRGVWPTWCTGVRTMPFSAHAWVAVDGTPVDEPCRADYYTAMLTIPPDAPRPPTAITPPGS